VIVSFFRLRTSTPQPSSTAFLGVKQVPVLLRGPQKVHVYSGILVQLTLGLGMLSWIEGWGDLRSISLCVVDAVLTSNMMVKVTNLLFFLQISAMAIFGLRHYLEVRIAKMEIKEGGGVVNYANEKGAAVRVLARTDTIKTFGFDTPSPPLPTEGFSKTTELKGSDEYQNGWPSGAREFGGDDKIVPQGPLTKPFKNYSLFPFDPRSYNPKLSAFIGNFPPIFSLPRLSPVKLSSESPVQHSSPSPLQRSFPSPTQVPPRSPVQISMPSPVQLSSQPPSAYGEYRDSWEVGSRPDVQNKKYQPSLNKKRNESFSRPFKGKEKEIDEAEEWFGMGKGEEKWLKEFGAFRRN
jgi:hypothetical protein